ncbi:Dabb family protein [Portibacter marinus]|uniref:Dabb family protein n=1 Tax=Portibacter marinus TaxID=2898660 RepID=UPI001F188C40|nr:Dabb family protein [Portibacter marinus]
MKLIPIVLLLFIINIPLMGQSALEETDKIYEMKVDSVLRHVVIFKWKYNTTQDKINEIEKSFAALPSKIKTIIDFEYGTNNSPEGLDKGFTHCFLVTFASEKGREIYLPHPDHQEFVKLIGDHVEDVLVFDYWSK